MKPTITALGTKRNMPPSFNSPATSITMPVSMARAKSAPSAFSPTWTCGTLATISDMALVAWMAMKTELVKKAPEKVPII